MESKEDRASYADCVQTPQSGPLRMFTELYREGEKEEGDRGDQEDKGGNQKERDRSSQ